MYYILIPADTVIPTPNGPANYSFAKFIAEFVLINPQWRKTWAASFGPTGRALCEAPPGAVVALEDEEREKVYQCVMAATPGAPFIFGVMPHMHAVTLATKEPPK